MDMAGHWGRIFLLGDMADNFVKWFIMGQIIAWRGHENSIGRADFRRSTPGRNGVVRLQKPILIQLAAERRGGWAR